MTDIFNISAPTIPPGLPPLVTHRLTRLGPGSEVDRERIKDVCGTATSANQFIHMATRRGLLVPTAHSSYRVPGESTVKLLARLANPLHQRFVSWATELEEIIGRDTVFLTPRIWRDTEINEPRPMPILKLGPRVTVVEGTPRQWEAFQMDFEDAETWALAINGVEERTFKVPTAKDSALIIRAGIGLGEPKLAAFGQTLEATLTRKQFAGLRHELASLQLQITPTGTTKARLGLGPPHRRRLLVPRWYEELTRIHLPHVGARRMDTLAGGTSLGT